MTLKDADDVKSDGKADVKDFRRNLRKKIRKLAKNIQKLVNVDTGLIRVTKHKDFYIDNEGNEWLQKYDTFMSKVSSLTQEIINVEVNRAFPFDEQSGFFSVDVEFLNRYWYLEEIQQIERRSDEVYAYIMKIIEYRKVTLPFMNSKDYGPNRVKIHHNLMGKIDELKLLHENMKELSKALYQSIYQSCKNIQ